MIITKTPFRISFFGGGTDYPAWYKENGGSVLTTAIDKFCYISCRHLPPFFDHKYRVVYSRIENVKDYRDIEHPAVRGILEYMNCNKGLEIHHDGDLPARSGLGSSSSFTVGLLNALHALQGDYRSPQQLGNEAIHIEQEIIKEHVGSQDQLAVAMGGFNRINFHQDGAFDVMPVIITPERMNQLQDSLMLFFTGIHRFSSDIAQNTVSNLNQNTDKLKAMGGMVDEAIEILQNKHQSIEDFGVLMGKSWQLKRTLSKKVSTNEIDNIYKTACDAGAVGGKVLGAGGGGFILFFVSKEKQESVRNSLSNLTYVPFNFEKSGSRVVLYQPNGL